MTKELEQVKQALKLADEAFGVWQVSCPNDAKAQKGLKEALAALEAYEARLDSDEFMDKAAEEGMIESREKACRYSYQQNNKRLSNA